MTEPSLAATMDEIATLKDFFQKAQDRLHNNEMVDMRGVDQRISALCKTVQAADPSHQQIFLPELATLIDQLNVYEKDLRKLHETIMKTEK